MKKEKDYTIAILIAIFLFAWLCSCTTYNKAIRGEITQVKGDTVQVQGQWFKVPGNKLKTGDYATFTPTVNRKKINSKQIR